MTTATPDTGPEMLIARTITFRNSTFGGLKAYIREHERKTGNRLSNAAAVDGILRAYLVYHIDRRAAHEMMTMATTAGAQALRAIDNREDAA
jgi:hypothetical protein